MSILEQVGDHKVTALYIKGEDGLSVLAKGSYHAELLDLMIENVAVVDLEIRQPRHSRLAVQLLDFGVCVPGSELAAKSIPCPDELR